jgi:hypothetical protein
VQETALGGSGGSSANAADIRGFYVSMRRIVS